MPGDSWGAPGARRRLGILNAMVQSDLTAGMQVERRGPGRVISGHHEWGVVVLEESSCGAAPCGLSQIGARWRDGRSQ